ncbi:hypothetical protein GGS20DRAFT_580501 [Poronia punctata]|nr:hypothetical protein GGS20DRAFT_580501 [Poronia punctata]
MAPVTPLLRSRMAITPRSHALSPGAIAGVVIGSVVGGFFALIVIGFLYFRYRRKLRAVRREDALPFPKAQQPHHVGPIPHQTVDASFGQGTFEEQERAPALRAGSSIQGLPATAADGDWTRNYELYAHQAGPFDPLPADINFSLPARQLTSPIATEHGPDLPLNHTSTAPGAANLTYYDSRISLESDPAQDSIAPSRQMSDLYEAQKKEAEEHQRSGSLHRRIWSTITRRQSSRGSKGTAGGGQHQQLDGPTMLGPAATRQESGRESPGRAGIDSFLIAAEYRVTEPEPMTECSGDYGLGPAGSKRIPEPRVQIQQGPFRSQTQESQYLWSPVHNDSVRETTETDPELPSSVLRPDPTYGLPPGAQPLSTSHRPERLNSPGIPDMMDLDLIQVTADEKSPFRPSSHSPQLSSESFAINPMAIWHPATPAEQAAYTTYQIKHSASPPAIPPPPPPPEIVTQQPTQKDAACSPTTKEEDLADMYLALSDDDNDEGDNVACVDGRHMVVDGGRRQSSDSLEYTTTPGQSSTTAESNGRTPDTRPTISPSPFTAIPQQPKLNAEHGASPVSSRPSPQYGPLICPECGREFDQIHKLNHHKRYHDRNHECPYAGCDKKFGTKTHLHRHINDRHLKLKAYHCTEPSCQWFKGGKSFPRKDNWRRHMVKKHGTTPQDFERMEQSL